MEHPRVETRTQRAEPLAQPATRTSARDAEENVRHDADSAIELRVDPAAVIAGAAVGSIGQDVCAGAIAPSAWSRASADTADALTAAEPPAGPAVVTAGLRIDTQPVAVDQAVAAAGARACRAVGLVPRAAVVTHTAVIERGAGVDTSPVTARLTRGAGAGANGADLSRWTGVSAGAAVERVRLQVDAETLAQAGPGGALALPVATTRGDRVARAAACAAVASIAREVDAARAVGACACLPSRHALAASGPAHPCAGEARRLLVDVAVAIIVAAVADFRRRRVRQAVAVVAVGATADARGKAVHVAVENDVLAHARGRVAALVRCAGIGVGAIAVRRADASAHAAPHRVTHLSGGATCGDRGVRAAHRTTAVVGAGDAVVATGVVGHADAPAIDAAVIGATDAVVAVGGAGALGRRPAVRGGAVGECADVRCGRVEARTRVGRCAGLGGGRR